MDTSDRTPLYHALHADRYARQERIKQIEKDTGRRLIVYISNNRHPGSAITQDDIPPFGDLLSDINGEPLDLFLHTGGGDVDAAEKLIYMIKGKSSGFRVVVPNFAKSAGTLIAMAADSIVMGYTSELGPIDPQLIHRNPDGSVNAMPAQSFLDGLESIKKAVQSEGGLSPAYFPLLNQLNPALLDYCQKAINRSKEFAEKWLSEGMLKDDKEQAKKVAAQLCDSRKYLSHGAVIDTKQAEHLKLKVEKLAADNKLWLDYWQLYMHYEIMLRKSNVAKVYESRVVALNLS